MKPQRKHVIAIALAGTLSLAASPLLAGDCPADKRVADGKGQKMVDFGPKDVTDTVIASTDLSTQKVALKDYQFRARRLTIQPGGIVPWHSHDERPAMIYVVKGEIVEYASSCGVPIVHKAGDVAREAKGTSHWWKNTGTEAVELISVDIFPPQMKKQERTM
ncbi:MAG: cupin domain-containing protein [Burkholderiales bacterium]|nr:cupin domain-containing protein [Burkholderiales bacterium]